MAARDRPELLDVGEDAPDERRAQRLGAREITVDPSVRIGRPPPRDADAGSEHDLVLVGKERNERSEPDACGDGRIDERAPRRRRQAPAEEARERPPHDDEERRREEEDEALGEERVEEREEEKAGRAPDEERRPRGIPLLAEEAPSDERHGDDQRAEERQRREQVILKTRELYTEIADVR